MILGFSGENKIKQILGYLILGFSGDLGISESELESEFNKIRFPEYQLSPVI